MSEISFPCCPHAACPHHHPDPHRPYREFSPWGSYKTKTFGSVRRFRCLACGHTFSTQTFSLDYYAKRSVDYRGLLGRLVSTSSLSAMGRAFGLSTDSISNRISRAARQALAAESRLARSRRPLEDLAADGFESFCVSQYFPNNIQVLVGSRSQFVYAADYATIRRKGSMTPFQKKKRSRLEERWRPDPKAVMRSFTRIAEDCVRVLSDEPRPALVLWTDRHWAYPQGIEHSVCAKALLSLGRLRHLTVSSREARTRQNPLFPVNYLDRELRKDLHEHVRESTAFGRNVNRQMERLVLYFFHHNFLKRHRARGALISHAELAGYDPRALPREVEMAFRQRALLSLTTLTPSREDTWLRRWVTPLREKRDYLPAYAAA